MISWFRKKKAKYGAKKDQKKKIENHYIQIKEELEKAKSMNNYLKFHVEHSKSEKIECCICQDNYIDTVLVACGHRVCYNCSSTIKHCPMCRAKITFHVTYF